MFEKSSLIIYKYIKLWIEYLISNISFSWINLLFFFIIICLKTFWYLYNIISDILVLYNFNIFFVLNHEINFYIILVYIIFIIIYKLILNYDTLSSFLNSFSIILISLLLILLEKSFKLSKFIFKICKYLNL